MAHEETTGARTALSDLVRTRRGELGLSLRGLADRCIDPDTGARDLIKYSWLDRLEKGLNVIPPQVPELRALAAGLQMPLRRLQDAAGAQFLGISPVELTNGIRALLYQAEQLSELDLLRLRAIAETFRDTSGGSG